MAADFPIFSSVTVPQVVIPGHQIKHKAPFPFWLGVRKLQEFPVNLGVLQPGFAA